MIPNSSLMNLPVGGAVLLGPMAVTMGLILRIWFWRSF